MASMTIPVPKMRRFLRYLLLLLRIIAVILFLTKNKQVIIRVIYVLISSREPREKNTGPSAYIIGEKSSADPFNCIPHIYDKMKSRVMTAAATEYAFNVLLLARKRTIANANNITAAHLSIELSKNGVAWLLSYNILKSGLPFISTADPPLSVRGTTEYFPCSLSCGLTPFSLFLASSMRVFLISRPAITF